MSQSEIVTKEVKFQIFFMPCCNRLLEWIDDRLPTCCPECGMRVFPMAKENIKMIDEKAILHINRKEIDKLNLSWME